jgi:hypothetical protein
MFSFTHGHLVVLVLFLEKLFFPFLIYVGILAENQLTINMKVSVWTLSSVLLIYTSILVLNFFLNALNS